MSDDKAYTLPHEAHEKIHQQIARKKLADTSARDNPKAVVLAGQPGAGKSGLVKRAVVDLSPNGGVVVVDTDALRAHHPKYKELLAENDRTAADLVQEDAGRWADELAQDAIAKQRNLIIDGTLKNPKNARRLCRDLKERGYEVEIRALAVSKEDSIQGVYARYEHRKSQDAPGRWVSEKEVHDPAYEGLPKTLSALEQGGYADRLTVYKRGEDGPVLVHSGRGASRALEKERDRERTPEELAARDEGWNREAGSPTAKDAGIMQRIRARDPALSEPENRRAAEHAAEARDKARNATTKESAGPWVKHSTSTKEAGRPWTEHSKSSPQQKARPKSPGKGR